MMTYSPVKICSLHRRMLGFDHDHNCFNTGAPGTRARRAARAEVHARAIGHDRVAGNPSLAPLPEERPETPEFDEITSIIPQLSFMGRPALYLYEYELVQGCLVRARTYVRSAVYCPSVQACTSTSLYAYVQASLWTSSCTSTCKCVM